MDRVFDVVRAIIDFFSRPVELSYKKLSFLEIEGTQCIFVFENITYKFNTLDCHLYMYPKNSNVLTVPECLNRNGATEEATASERLYIEVLFKSLFIYKNRTIIGGRQQRTSKRSSSRSSRSNSRRQN
jgi:hypothetical protein